MTSVGSTFVDFFSGSGIMSYGFKNLGFSVTKGFEINDDRCKTFGKNLSVRSEPFDLLDANLDAVNVVLGKFTKELDVVTGCPPCQSFSSLHRTRGSSTLSDDRTRLVKKYAELAVGLRPKVVVFENVSGMLTADNNAFFQDYLRIIDSAGYDASWKLIDAADYGVPQHRKRIVAISILRELMVKSSLPEPTHSRNGLGGTKKWKTVRDAIGNLRPLESGEADPGDPLHHATFHEKNTLKIMRAIPKNGGSRRSLPDELVLPCHRRLAKNKGAESVYGRMKWDEPSPTITGAAIRPSSGRFIHPDQDRGITLREMARLQTIPDDFQFQGSKDAIASMIGDAVPFELARAIARHVKFLLKEAGY